MSSQRNTHSLLQPILARLATLIATGVLIAMSSTAVAQSSTTSGAYPSDAEGFAFLNGQWRVHNRKLKDPVGGREEWIEFESSASFITLLDGLVSVEELRDAKGAPFGSAMRTFDRERRTWSDAWVSARDGVLQLPMHGKFEGDTGTWTTQDTYNSEPILARGVWKRVTKDEVTWEQLFSRNDGKTWQSTWKMRFVRVGGKDGPGR